MVNKLTNKLNLKFPLPVAFDNLQNATSILSMTNNDISKLESGASSHYLKKEHEQMLIKV